MMIKSRRLGAGSVFGVRPRSLGVAGLIGITAAIGAFPGQLYAQAGTAAEKRGGLEEIIVTARRKEESVQDVPISMSVFNQQTLDERNVVSGADLATYTPSLTVNTRFGPDQASFAIRGFTQELRTTASVGAYFADVVAPRGGGSVTAGDGAGPGAFFDLQNVQVLKGPQGTLFGRNTTGGAILLVPQKPTYDLEGYVEGSAGDFDLQRAQGVINVPLGERARARFGADYQKRNGYLKNGSGVGPEDLGDIDYIAGRASLVMDLTNSLENYSILTYAHSENSGTVSGVFACNPNLVNGRRVGLATFCDAQLATQDKDFYAVQSPTPEPLNELKQWQAINTTTWQATDNFTVKNIIAYSDMEQTNRTSVFGTNFAVPSALPVIGGIRFPFTNSAQVPGIPTNSQQGLVEELQFQGNALDNKLTWQGGLYYENSKPDGLSGSQSQNQIYCAAPPGVDPTTFRCQDVLRQLAFFGAGGTVPISRLNAAGTVQRQLGRVEYENKAVYTQATYTITDVFKVTSGIRYTWDETSGTSQQIVYRQFPGLTAGPPGALPFIPATGTPPAATACVITTAALPDCLIKLSQKSEAPTWLVGVDYLPTDDILLYAKYTRGYRQGSINIFGAEGFQTHEPEKVDAYEVGAKTSFGGPIPGSFNIAAFYNDLTDQQIQAGFQSSTGAASPTTGILNAGSSTIQGVEVESTFMLFEGMSLDLLTRTWILS